MLLTEENQEYFIRRYRRCGLDNPNVRRLETTVKGLVGVADLGGQSFYSNMQAERTKDTNEEITKQQFKQNLLNSYDPSLGDRSVFELVVGFYCDWFLNPMFWKDNKSIEYNFFSYIRSVAKDFPDLEGERDHFNLKLRRLCRCSKEEYKIDSDDKAGDKKSSVDTQQIEEEIIYFNY